MRRTEHTHTQIYAYTNKHEPTVEGQPSSRARATARPAKENTAPGYYYVREVLSCRPRQRQR